MNRNSFLSACLIALAFGLVAAPSAHAQQIVPLTLEEFGTPSIEDTDHPLEKLARDYYAGNWTDLQKKTGRLFENFDFGSHAFDPDLHYYSVVFVSFGAGPEGEILRYLHHTTANQLTPYGTALPGLRDGNGAQLYDIYLSVDGVGVLQSEYKSAPGVDPRLAQVPKLLGMFDDAALGLFDLRVATAAAAPTVKTSQTFSVSWTLRHIALPHDRATISVSDSIRYPAADRLAAFENGRVTPSTSPAGCVDHMIVALEAAIDDWYKDQGPACSFAASAAGCWTALHSGINRAAALALKDSTCRANGPREAATEVARQYHALVTRAQVTELTHDSTYTNTPIDRWSLGLATGAILGGGSSDSRARVGGNGALVPNPLRGVLTLATVNVHLAPRHPGDPRSTSDRDFGERWSFFVGPVLAPEFGLASGFRFEPWIPGVGLTGGVGVLAIDKLKGDFQFGDFPNTISGDDPFELGTAWIYFVGLGYSFE